MSRTTSFDNQPIENLPSMSPAIPERLSIRDRLIRHQPSSTITKPSIVVTCIGLWVAVLCAFALLIVSTSIARKSDPEVIRYVKLNGQLYLDLDKKQLTVRDSSLTKDVLSVNLGQNVGTGYKVTQSTDDTISVSWPDTQSSLVIKFVPFKDRTEYQILWDTKTLWSLQDVISMKGAHWYGGAEMLYQRWPIEKVSTVMRPYIGHNLYQAVQERYWLSSDKVAIMVPDQVPLWFAQKNSSHDPSLVFKSQYKGAVYQNFVDITLVRPWLNYKVIVPPKYNPSKLKDFHLTIINEYYSKPTATPDQRMMRYPIWSTWAKYKKNVNDTTVMDFAQQIIDHKFNNSQLEIDDKWQTFYGDLTPDPAKFPNFRQTVQNLQRKGFRTTVWVHPFVNAESKTGQSKLTQPELVSPCNAQPFTTGLDQLIPAWVSWWDGIAGSVDVTNPITADWYVTRLQKLRSQSGILGFKFDAGDAIYLGPCYTLYNATYPNEYSKKYAETAAKLGNAIEVRVGARTQHLPVFVRTLDKSSWWGYDNGLKALITGTLMFGFLGYPFVLPDMVGGNAYDAFPTKELYIRWVQANTFLPAIQFSIVPWEYDIEVVQICQRMMMVREKWFQYIDQVAQQSVTTGAPMIRPMWWADESEMSLTADGQFFLGDKLLVAPVMDKGATSKDIYLPQGKWLSAIDNKIYEGPLKFTQQVPLEQLAYFVKQ